MFALADCLKANGIKPSFATIHSSSGSRRRPRSRWRLNSASYSASMVALVTRDAYSAAPGEPMWRWECSRPRSVQYPRSASVSRMRRTSPLASSERGGRPMASAPEFRSHSIDGRVFSYNTIVGRARQDKQREGFNGSGRAGGARRFVRVKDLARCSACATGRSVRWITGARSPGCSGLGGT